MTLIERVKRMFTAGVHDALDRVEDPGKLIKQRVRELEDANREARASLADFSVSVKKLEKEQEQLKRLAAEWQLKAEQAVKVGDEDSARKALEERLKSDERCSALAPSLKEAQSSYLKLKEQFAVLQDQLRVAKLKAAELQSRQHAAEAQKTFGSHFDKATGAAGDPDFDKMESKVIQQESELEIDRDVRSDLATVERTLDRQERDLKVAAELEALKRQKKA